MKTDIMSTSEELEVEVHVSGEQSVEPDKERSEDTSSVMTEKVSSIKQKRKQLRGKITRTINRLVESMNKQEMTKRRSEKELTELRKNFDKATELHSELYEFDDAPSARLDKWESDLANDVYSIEERIEDYLKNLPERKGVITRSVSKKKASIEVAEESSSSESGEDLETASEHMSEYETETRSKRRSSDSVAKERVVAVDSWIDALVEFRETELPHEIKNMSVAEALYRLEASRDIPSLKLLTFNGNPLQYVEFVESFKVHIHNKPNLSDDLRMMQLRMHLSGDAERSISGLGTGGIMYATALKTLKEQFGQYSVIARTFIRRLTEGQKIRAADREGLRTFSVDVINCLATLRRINYMSDVNATETLRRIVSRLPGFMILKWKSTVASLRENNIQPTLQHISEFIQKQVKAEFDPDFGDVESLTSRYKMPQDKRKGIHSAQSRPDYRKKTLKCYICEELHRIHDCPTFRDSSVQERIYLIRRHRLCFSCLTRGHNVRDCRSRKACGTNDCTRTHNSLIHIDPPTASGASSILDKASILPVVRVSFRSSNGRIRQGNVLIDSGAGTTIIRKEFAKALGLQGKRQELDIAVVGGECFKERDSRQVTFWISPLEGGEEFFIEAHEISKTVLSVSPLDRSWLSSFVHLRDISFPHKAGPIDLILGVQYSHLHAERASREGLPFEPVAKKTRLGWIVMGSDQEQKSIISSVSCVQNVEIEKMYDIETLGVKAPHCKCSNTLLTEDERISLELFESSCSLENKRFTIGLPWKKDPLMLPDNYSLAEKRLCALEKNLKKDPEKSKLYCKTINDYEAKGWAERTEDMTTEPRYYLPHHGVYRPDKISTPLRVVFDPACTFQGVSLNSFLYKGPSLLGNLFGTLVRFREEHVAFVGDISKMYLQICLPEKDTHVHRYLWRDLDTEREPTIYRLLRVTFGDKPSPDMANFVMLKMAEMNKEDFPDVAVVLQRDRYMDDIIHSCESADIAVDKMKKLDTVLATGSFQIKEWFCSSGEARAEVKGSLETGKTSDEKGILLGEEEDHVKTLGVVWKCSTDTLHFKIQHLHLEVYTKRAILSRLSMLFDPLGLAAVTTIRARIAMQQIWKLKRIDWDDTLPDKMQEQWSELFTDLAKLGEIEYQRCLKPDNAIAGPELHVFSDASSHAYGAIAYILWITPEGPSVKLIASKSRVAPLKQQTIPRLELMAALLASRLARTLFDELKFKPEVFLWSDSQIVLHWLCSESTTKKAFVGVRVAEIQSEWDTARWRFVPTKMNPADDLSRGVKVENIPQRWVCGPDFLNETKDKWPDQIAEDPYYDLEDKRSDIMCGSTKPVNLEPILDCQTFSSWPRLIRVTAYCLRFINNLKCRVLGSSNIKHGSLEPEETQNAEIYWVCEAQRSLGDWKKTCRDLTPFEKDGIIRVGGRLRKAPLSYDQCHPVLLPASCYISKLILRDVHKKVGHGGYERTLSESRRKFWIIRGRNLVKEIVRSCIECKKLRQPTHTTLMADIPSYRLKLFSPPFSTTGVDLFGPLFLKYGRNKKCKAWGAIFTCATVRAVHFEVVESLSTDSFMHALRRFASHRGWPSIIISDNGTSFIGTQRELRRLFEDGRQELQDFSVLQNFRWIFTSPLSPHQGGIYESLIKQTKRAIQTSVGQQILSWNELTTVFAEVKCLLNSRPLGYCSDDPNDCQPLTPNHFLIGRASVEVPQCRFDDSRSLCKRFQFVQCLVMQIWKRFVREYLPSLMKRAKWRKKGRQLQIGDIVLLVDYNLPRGKWNMGKVTETYPGDDGVIRNVKVQTQFGEYKRSVQKCCPILEADSD